MKIKELIKQLIQIEKEQAGISNNDVVVESIDIAIPRLVIKYVFFDHKVKETAILVEPERNDFIYKE